MYDMYSCEPHVVEVMMKVAARKRVPIKVMDVVNSVPQGVSIISSDKEIVQLVMSAMLQDDMQNCAN